MRKSGPLEPYRNEQIPPQMQTATMNLPSQESPERYLGEKGREENSRQREKHRPSPGDSGEHGQGEAEKDGDAEAAAPGV